MQKASKIILTVALCGIITGIPNDPAAPAPPTEYEIKAAFLYKFASFVEWPNKSFSSSNSPIVIGVLGQDPFGSVLDRTIEGKTIDGRRFAVKRAAESADLKTCHILFISSSERTSIKKILSDVKGASVLTVGDVEGLVERGVIINFNVANNKVGFEINVNAAKRAGLKISSKLLKLASRTIN